MTVKTFSRLGMWLANRIPLWVLPAGRITYVRMGRVIGLQIVFGKEN
jgi:hypothetical protein